MWSWRFCDGGEVVDVMYRCCSHCLVNREGVCDHAKTGHAQTCPERCREGSLPFEEDAPKAKEAPKPKPKTKPKSPAQARHEALREQIAAKQGGE